MVLAVLYFDVKAGADLPASLSKSSDLFTAASGYRGHDLKRGVEDPDRYLLTVEWDSVDDHMNWQKAHAAQFLGILQPMLVRPPDIKHFA